MVPERISLITITSVDIPRLRTFYRKLGWRESPDSSDTYVIFRTAGVLLTLFPLQEMAAEIGTKLEPCAGGIRAGVTLSINVDKKEDIDRAAETVRKAGGTILREPSEAFWGGRLSYFADPDHNLWEIAWNPASVFDERGAMLSF